MGESDSLCKRDARERERERERERTALGVKLLSRSFILPSVNHGLLKFKFILLWREMNEKERSWRRERGRGNVRV
jgi:hypothetical protein